MSTAQRSNCFEKGKFEKHQIFFILILIFLSWIALFFGKTVFVTSLRSSVKESHLKEGNINHKYYIDKDNVRIAWPISNGVVNI